MLRSRVRMLSVLVGMMLISPFLQQVPASAFSTFDQHRFFQDVNGRRYFILDSATTLATSPKTLFRNGTPSLRRSSIQEP